MTGECEHDDGVSGVGTWHSEPVFTCNLCGCEMWATGPDPDDAWEPADPQPVVLERQDEHAAHREALWARAQTLLTGE